MGLGIPINETAFTGNEGLHLCGNHERGPHMMEMPSYCASLAVVIVHARKVGQTASRKLRNNCLRYLLEDLRRDCVGWLEVCLTFSLLLSITEGILALLRQFATKNRGNVKCHVLLSRLLAQRNLKIALWH